MKARAMKLFAALVLGAALAASCRGSSGGGGRETGNQGAAPGETRWGQFEWGAADWTGK